MLSRADFEVSISVNYFRALISMPIPCFVEASGAAALQFGGPLICSDADPNRLIMTQTERKESRIYDFPFEPIPKWRNIWLLPFPICAHIAISFNMFSHRFCILGVFNKSIFFRLDRICEDCYSLFREVELHSLCKWVSCSSCCSYRSTKARDLRRDSFARVGFQS